MAYADGHSYREIAVMFLISVNTVKTTLQRIRRKTGRTSRASLIVWLYTQEKTSATHPTETPSFAGGHHLR